MELLAVITVSYILHSYLFTVGAVAFCLCMSVRRVLVLVLDFCFLPLAVLALLSPRFISSSLRLSLSFFTPCQNRSLNTQSFRWLITFCADYIFKIRFIHVCNLVWRHTIEEDASHLDHICLFVFFEFILWIIFKYTLWIIFKYTLCIILKYILYHF